MIATAQAPDARPRPAEPAAAAKPAAAKDDLTGGLTDEEARSRLAKFGPNAMPDTALHPLRMALEKFWAPVPWMLEAAIVLEVALGKYVEAGIIAGLLIFNAALGLFQESRAQATLAALKSRLALNASVRRDGAWKTIPASELVPGDVVKLSLGAVVVADVKLTVGEVLLDQSTLTGESVPIEAGAGNSTMRNAIVVSLCLIFSPAIAHGQSPSSATAPVTVDNFVRSETDNYLATNAKENGIGRLGHRREPASIDNQTVIRLNRDTLYSFGVFDLAAGPLTITLPNAGKRFMSMQIINEDHYVPFVTYDDKPHTLTEKNVGTRYVMVAIRTLVDPNDPKDLDEVHKLQDTIKVSQKDIGKLDLPNWDQASLKEIRDALLVLAKHTDSFKHAFGTKDEVDPIKHLIGTAAGWGGNPDKDATYIGANVPKNDGTTIYRLHVKDVPVNAFWSVSVYNAAGYFEKNPNNAYTLNNLTAKKDADGAVTIQFGGCDGKISNCLPIMPGWNYTVRLYRPRAEILSGKWKFPNPEPVG